MILHLIVDTAKTNWQAHSDAILTITNTPKNTLGFGLDTVQKTMKAQNRMRTNCLVHRRSVIFLALSTLLEKFIILVLMPSKRL